MRRELVVVGCSWGGLAALRELLRGVPGDLGAALVVAQHRMPGTGDGALEGLLQEHSALPVAEAEDKELLRPGHVYLCPPDYHVLVERGALHLSVEGRVRHSRPSIDVLFETAADAYEEDVVGVLLTGANDDGAAGLERIHECGGYAVVQDPGEAERAEMPLAALRRFRPDRVARLAEIGPLLAELCGKAAEG